MLSTQFSKAGYHTAFYYGGELEFANIKAYLLGGSFSNFISINDFEKKDQNSKWGAHDGVVMQKIFSDLNKQPQPFFYTWLTLSSHEPFETPGLVLIKGNDDANKFRNTAAYTDKCLGNYFREASKSKWFSTTLFILVADHGHRLPQENDLNLPKAKHIPLLFAGEVIKDSLRGSVISRIGNQHDIAATLLHQLQLNSTRYEWSKDLLCKSTKDFAYYSNENVLGWVTSNDTTAYSFIEKRNSASSKSSPSSESNAQAYLQKLYREFLKY